MSLTTKAPWDESLEIPAIYEICGRCEGKGTHTNPAIDGNGIGQAERDDWADDDFMEDYMNGVYDVRCEEGCENGKVLVPDVLSLTSDQQKELEDWHQQVAEDRAERAAELRWGY